jgi:hypothetical protein
MYNFSTVHVGDLIQLNIQDKLTVVRYLIQLNIQDKLTVVRYLIHSLIFRTS